MISVSVRLDPSFDFGNSEVVFEKSDLNLFGAAGRRYDVASDGRFLMILEDESRDRPMNLAVVLNWIDELDRLAPSEN